MNAASISVAILLTGLPGADAHIGPLGSYDFAGDPRKIGAFCRADVGIGPYS